MYRLQNASKPIFINSRWQISKIVCIPALSTDYCLRHQLEFGILLVLSITHTCTRSRRIDFQEMAAAFGRNGYLIAPKCCLPHCIRRTQKSHHYCKCMIYTFWNAERGTFWNVEIRVFLPQEAGIDSAEWSYLRQITWAVLRRRKCYPSEESSYSYLFSKQSSENIPTSNLSLDWSYSFYLYAST